MTEEGADAAANPDSPAVTSAVKPKKAPLTIEIQELKDVIVGDLAESGNWIVANIETSSYWPVNAQNLKYRGETIWILPVTNKYFPALAMKAVISLEPDECQRILMQFLSTLSWVLEHGMSVNSFSGGNLPRPMGRDKTSGFAIAEEFDLSYFPEPHDEKALLALALMREGRGLNHPGYAFLSFYRVLEVALPNGRARGKWITDQLDTLSEHRAKQALANLNVQGIVDIGAYLLESGRRAVAHAREEPIMNPDDPADFRRFRSELPIMVSLASTAIEEILGVETSHTVYRKHLYELAGFKTILGPELVSRIARAEPIAQGTLIDLPQINLRLRRHGPFAPLEKLSPVEVGQDGSVLLVRFGSDDGNVHIQFGLNLETERLEFDMFRDFAIRDSGTADGALAVLDLKRFQHAYFGNGKIEIYDADSDVLLSRLDAYIPLNMMFDSDAAEAELAHWEHLAAERRSSEVVDA